MSARAPRLLWIVVALAGLGGSVAAAAPATARASGESASTAVLALLNGDRTAAGLRALRVDPRLAGLASDRAAAIAGTGELSHTSYGGEVPAAVAGVGVAAYSSGEVLGSTNASSGTAAAQYIYSLWKASPIHWALIMSTAYNYLGTGVALRPSTGGTFVSIVFAEAPDVTAPVSAMTRATAKGTTASFGWTGQDGFLQSHTAGLRDFDVEYRVDGGNWKMLRAQTSATSIVLAGRPRGHTYSIRVRDRDRRGNVSEWSAARSVRVP